MTAERKTPRVSEYEVLLKATERLEQAIAADDGDPVGTVTVLERAARGVIRAFERHRHAAEADDGNLATIAATKPALIRAIGLLKDEHVDLLAKANALADEIHTARAFDEIPTERFRLSARVLCDSIKLHMQSGADLLYEAYYRVEGGEGG